MNTNHTAKRRPAPFTRPQGIQGLYRGMLSPLLGVTPINAIMFLGYGFGKKIQQSSPSDVLT